MKFDKKIDFAVLLSVTNANPNGRAVAELFSVFRVDASMMPAVRLLALRHCIKTRSPAQPI